MDVVQTEKSLYEKYIRIFLYLVAFHSFAVALALMFSPSMLMEFFGYSAITEPFFKVQAGVFHIVMVVAYIYAAIDPLRNRIMITYSITVKFIATVFLIIYFVFIDPVLVIILSGLGDLIMGLVLLYLYRKLFLYCNTIG